MRRSRVRSPNSSLSTLTWWSGIAFAARAEQQPRRGGRLCCLTFVTVRGPLLIIRSVDEPGLPTVDRPGGWLEGDREIDRPCWRRGRWGHRIDRELGGARVVAYQHRGRPSSDRLDARLVTVLRAADPARAAGRPCDRCRAGALPGCTRRPGGRPRTGRNARAHDPGAPGRYRSLQRHRHFRNDAPGRQPQGQRARVRRCMRTQVCAEP